LLDALFRFGSIHLSPDSGWQGETRRLYGAAVRVSVQYSTLHPIKYTSDPTRGWIHRQSHIIEKQKLFTSEHLVAIHACILQCDGRETPKVK